LASKEFKLLGHRKKVVLKSMKPATGCSFAMIIVKFIAKKTIEGGGGGGGRCTAGM